MNSSLIPINSSLDGQFAYMYTCTQMDRYRVWYGVNVHVAPYEYRPVFYIMIMVIIIIMILIIIMNLPSI